LKILFNIILQPMPRSSKWSLSLRSPNQNCVSHEAHEYQSLFITQSAHVAITALEMIRLQAVFHSESHVSSHFTSYLQRLSEQSKNTARN
jgi:hypothetical protein